MFSLVEDIKLSSSAVQPMVSMRGITVSALLLQVLISTAVLAKSQFVDSDAETVLINDETLLSASSNETIFHDGYCAVGLTTEGRLYVGRKVDAYGYYPYTEAWSTKSSDLGSGDYYAKINQDDGSLEIYKSQSEGDKVSWRTAAYASPLSPWYPNVTKPYLLKIDETCVLRLIGKHSYEDGIIMDREIWSNSRRSMTNYDIMQQGDILSGHIYMCSDGSSGHVFCVDSISSYLRLQNDCNIVQKVGVDGADDEYASIVWDSKSDQKGDPDCYIFNNGDFIGVFEGKWDDYDRETLYPERQGLIWRTPEKYESGYTQDNWEETSLSDDKGFLPD